MKNFVGIELLRFFSSLSILIYHWGTSFQIMGMKENFHFNNFLQLIYKNGHYAVFVFFVISGVVFSKVYLTSKNKENLFNFSVKRFARLYPLHLLTLFLILFIQLFFYKIFGHFELYKDNNLFNFILNFFLILGWKLDLGRSFNSPVWTVGQELVIYYLFFMFINSIKKNSFKTVFIVYLFFLLLDRSKFSNYLFEHSSIYLNNFVELVRYFFSGILIFYLNLNVKNNKTIALIIIFSLIVSFVGSFKVHIFSFGIVLFFVFLDRIITYSKLKNTFIFLGNLTYSIYLLHTFTFLLFLFLLKFFDKIHLFYSQLTFVFYIVFTLALSMLSFNFFENKFNKIIRLKFLKKQDKF